jgi:hypothetical protein
LWDSPQKQLNAGDDTNTRANPNLSAVGGIVFRRVRPMASEKHFEQTVTSIASLGRDELKKRIRNFKGRFRLDFTDNYLDNLGVDRLRHILLAALINAKPDD